MSEPKTRPPTLVETQTGRNLITLAAAAELAGVHPVSMRRLVAKGVIRRRARVGRSVLVEKEEVAAYAAGQAHVFFEGRMDALVSIEKRKGLFRPFRLKDFRWDYLPILQRRVRTQFGDVRFLLEITLGDGARFDLRYTPKKAA